MTVFSGRAPVAAEFGGSSPIVVDEFEVTDLPVGAGLFAAVAARAGTRLSVILDDTTAKSVARSTPPGRGDGLPARVNDGAARDVPTSQRVLGEGHATHLQRPG